jgi:AcrR family transcriptional regulator
MDQELLNIILKFRNYLDHRGIPNVSLKELSKKIDIPLATLRKYAMSEDQLVEKVLEYERRKFEEIFETHDFEGVNAIDILLTVSREVAGGFIDLSPSITFEVKKYYPDIYQRHFAERVDFIYKKIQINLTKGINQGIYRDDLSIELIARLYLARLSDLHNPDYFPPEQFSFETIFNTMFENFVRSIAKPEGLEYFEKRRLDYKL